MGDHFKDHRECHRGAWRFIQVKVGRRFTVARPLFTASICIRHAAGAGFRGRAFFSSETKGNKHPVNTPGRGHGSVLRGRNPFPGQSTPDTPRTPPPGQRNLFPDPPDRRFVVVAKWFREVLFFQSPILPWGGLDTVCPRLARAPVVSCRTSPARKWVSCRHDFR